MLRRFAHLGLGLVLVMPCLVLAPAQAPASGPAPFYSLPTDGTWVQYEWKGLGADQKPHTGTLRISSVGRTPAPDGRFARWIEIKHEMGNTGIIRKLLVPEAAVPEGKLVGKVVEGYGRPISGDEVRRLAANEINDLLTLGVHTPTGGFTVIEEKAAIETKLGKLITRHVAASGKANESTTLEYAGWLTEAVSFGWARFEMREKTNDQPARLLFSVTAIATGKEAKSEVDETKAK
jgi:hypothetical protein